MSEFDYKPAEFYSRYFENHPDFKVLKPFRLSEDKDEKNLFVGRVETLNTIHPIELRIEIPVSFPHHKLIFRTKSLSGYPHLIHTGKIQYGDWFCLNTPFAETAEEQLKQEVTRLKEWIQQQLKEDIPAIIKDSQLKEALSAISLPEWMNQDAVKEVQAKSLLTFIGNFANSSDNFANESGTFHCIKTPDNRFYAFKDNYSFTAFELPYVIVDIPDDIDIVHDFLALRDYYKWGESICNILLPGYKVGKSLDTRHSYKGDLNIDEETALHQIETIRGELTKDESYLNPTEGDRWLSELLKSSSPQRVRVSLSHRELVLRELKKIEEKVKIDHGIKTPPQRYRYSIPEEEWTDKDWEEEAQVNDWAERGQFVFDYFALGLKSKSNLFWMILYTNHAALRFKQKCYNVEIGEVLINQPTSFPLNYSKAQILDESMFFGRGALCKDIRHKQVAVIGLGAIGSMVAEALAHSGIQKIGLWDSDIVEPGNICRSIYTLQDIGESKVQAVAKKLRTINPFIETNDIKASGKWIEYMGPNYIRYDNGSFYDNINYTSQSDAVEKIKDYNLIIDCTGRNEILHFISYALPDTDIISLAITNKAKELLCITNRSGNPFEIRKAYLSAIAQNTKDYYVEGSGCYEPTFKATYFDICSLVNLCIREINTNMDNGRLMNSTIFRYSDRGIVADIIHSYRLLNSDITLNIPNEVLLDGEDLPESYSDYLGFIFGSYSKDGKQIMITHIVAPEHAAKLLEDAYSKSKGIIDYIGDVSYSNTERGTFKPNSFEDIAAKAMDKDINTNNPLLAIRNPEGDFSFFLYINDALIPFYKRDKE